ncbi:MAG: hypothetical protein WC744_02670 [Patescibacteria group bacterium]|jgi:hypothetical protein
MSNPIKIPKDLEQQLNKFIDLQTNNVLNHYNDPKLRETTKLNFVWLKKFSELHFKTRTQRAQELSSPEVAKAKKLAKDYIGQKNHDFFVTCVDGRNMPSVMFSKPPQVGGALRTPAGVVNGFMEGQTKGSVFIDPDSYVVKQIITLLKEKAGDTIYYGLDSHLGCAARAQIHSTEGGRQIDGGVRADIVNKLITAKGIVELQKQLENSGEKVAKIIPILFSYDPSTGGVISGLEVHIENDKVANFGFTKEVLDKLTLENKIVRTTDLLKDKIIVQILEKVIKPGTADFRNRYPQSLLSNWQATTKLYDHGQGEIFLLIFKKLISIYKKTDISETTLKQKAKFLLKNLVTRFSIAGTGDSWPFAHHNEEMIVITDGGYAPFPALDAFSIFPRDPFLLTNTKLTIDLIRTFRKAGKLKDPISGSKFSQDDFFSSPVFISNKSVIRNFQEKSWESLKALDLDSTFAGIKWDDPVILNWTKSDIQKFIMQTIVDKKIDFEFSDTLRFINGIYELFDRMRLMMKDKNFRQMILHGNIVIFNTLVDHNRMPRYLVPFVV